MTTNNPTSPREELARIIDPAPWEGPYAGLNIVAAERDAALAKADEWLSRPPVKSASPEGEAWVLQRNDRPHAVYFDETNAKAACASQREKERRWREENAHVADVRTYWNVYKADRPVTLTTAPTTERAEVVAWPNDKPPPHWSPDDQFDRHPKSADDWDWQLDWRTDPDGDSRRDRMIRRLNFAADMADPRAPDQMALVLRKDLIDVKHRLLRAEALADLYKRQAATPPKPEAPTKGWRIGQALTVVQTDEPGHWSLDWRPDHIVYFAGWTWDQSEGRESVWVSDVWPPRHNGDITDGWDPIDLAAAPTHDSENSQGDVTRNPTDAEVETEARAIRCRDMHPRPDSDWDEPGKIHEDNKNEFRRLARERLSAPGSQGEES